MHPVPRVSAVASQPWSGSFSSLPCASAVHRGTPSWFPVCFAFLRHSHFAKITDCFWLSQFSLWSLVHPALTNALVAFARKHSNQCVLVLVAPLTPLVQY